MDRYTKPLWILLLVNAALAALLGLGLAIAPDGVLGLFPAAVKPGSPVLLQVIGLLLFGISISLWTLVDVRRTDALSQGPRIVAVGLAFAWIAVVLISRGAASPDSGVLFFVSTGMLVAGVFAVLYRRTGPAAPDPAGESAAQQERRRLARDLHDSIKQQLFSIKLSSAAAEERWESDPGGARTALADVRRSAHAAMVEMQAMLSQLRPEPLTTAGLVEALREQCEALGYRSGIPVHLEIGDLPPDSRLPDSTRENLFRVAQEALSNVARHARAGEVRVRLGKIRHDGSSALLLEVRDDGQGFDPAGRPAGMGLRNMRERLEVVRGTLEVRSAPGEGTEVRALAPLTPRKAPVDPVRKLMGETSFVMILAFFWDKPSLAYAAVAVIVVILGALEERGLRAAPEVRLKLFRHQHRFLLLTMAFWWICAVEPALEVPNPMYRWLAVPLYWLDHAARLASPVLLLLALREAWGYFRLRRSLDGPASEAGLPAWVFAATLLLLLASLPLLFLAPDPWAVARSGMLSCAILYLGWRLRTVS